MRWLALSLLLAACGGPPPVTQVKFIEPPKERVLAGPKATKEELAGEVPALRGPKSAAPRGAPKFVPPEPPADPKPDFQ